MLMLLERGSRGICFDIPHTVFASHDVTHDVFCKIVTFGQINNTFFGAVVHWAS